MAVATGTSGHAVCMDSGQTLKSRQLALLIVADGVHAPVILGLATGVGFIALFALLASNALPLYQKPLSDTQNDFKAAEKMARDLDEVKEFLSVYPNANSTVYFIQVCNDDSCSSYSRIPSTVEYSYVGDGGKYAELRVNIDHEEIKPVFIQVRCTIYGTEEVGIQNHGTSLEKIDEFLQDSRCPN